jgi:hypothetical protein
MAAPAAAAVTLDSPLEALCPDLGAWFDCTAVRSVKGGASFEVQPAEPEHVAAAGASWAAASPVLPAAQLRRRSEAAQDADCDALQPGAAALCLLRRGGGLAPLWLDAALLRVARFPHRASGECQARHVCGIARCCFADSDATLGAAQCFFTVRWRAGPCCGETAEVQLDRLCLRPWEASDAQAAAEAAAEAAALPAPPSAGAAAPFLCDARVASAVTEFFAWCSWREEAHEARRAGRAPPWAQHPLLAAHHFCNVSRCDDRGTAAFHALLRAQRVTSLPGVLWASLVYRRLNRLATFAAWRGGRLPLPADAAAWAAWAAQRGAEPGAPPLFTGKHQQSGGLDAYLSTVRGLAGLDTPPAPGFPHAKALAAALAACPGAREAHGTLKAHVRHVGDFIAWQVTCDLVEAGVLPRAADDAWVALGPGARAGLALLFGDGADKADAMARLRALQAAQPWALRALRRGSHGIVAAGEDDAPLLLRDLEHSLCEFSKWFALRRGGPGSGPGAYTPGAEPLPLLPRLRVQRLDGTAFRVVPPEDDKAMVPGEEAECAAFPASGVAADGADEPPPLAPWLPRDTPGGGRRSSGGPRAPRGPEAPKGPRPARAALLAWFDAFWPAAQAAGWVCVTKTRQAGATAGTSDCYWISPAGRRMRSRAEVAVHEGAVLTPPGEDGEAAPADDAADADEAGGSDEEEEAEPDADADELPRADAAVGARKKARVAL